VIWLKLYKVKQLSAKSIVLNLLRNAICELHEYTATIWKE